MNRKVERFIILFICFFTCLGFIGCKNKKPQDENEVIDMLKSINKYTSDVEINIINDKQKIVLNGHQEYDKGKVCKLKLNDNREFLYKDGKIHVKDKENKKQYTINEDFDIFYKLSFVEQYVNLIYNNQNVKYKYKTIDDKEYMEVLLDLPYMNRSLTKAELYVDYKNVTPYKVKIYNHKNEEKVNIIYKNFTNE